MGGTVSVTVKKDGILKKMARKTGSYDFMLFSKDMLDGNINKAYEEYCKVFDEMRDDYLSGAPYKFAMAPVYGWYESFAPGGYGLVFIDFDKKEIHSMQGYNTPGEFSLTELGLMERNNRDINISNNKVLKEFIDKDMVNIKIVKDDKRIDYSISEFCNIYGLKDISELIKMETDMYTTKGKLKSILFNKNPSLNSIDGFSQINTYDVEFTLKDFKINKYDEDFDGCLNLFNAVKQYVKPEEIEIWIEFAKDFLEDYEFDDEFLDKLYEDKVEQNVIDNHIESLIENLLKNFKKDESKLKL